MILSMQMAESYAAQAGFSNAIVPKSKYAPGNLTQIQTIVGIAIAESNLDTTAHNASDPYGGSYGVLQINGFWFSHGFTQAQALDPKQSFQFAYSTISHHGTSFTDWGTFTSGAYLKYAQQANSGSANILPKDGWWNYPIVGNFGDFPDRQGYYPQPDVNIGVPYNYPVASPVSGVVSGINWPDQSIPSFGAVVTIKMDQPLNALATHIAFLHLAVVNVRPNQRVNIGDIVARAGDANHAAGSAPASLGVALWPDAFYGYGSSWTKYIDTPNHKADSRLDPGPFIAALKNGTFVPTSGFTTGGVQQSEFLNNLGAAVTNAASKVKLVPDEEVVALLIVVNDITTVQNPIPPTGSPDWTNFQWIGDIIGGIFLNLSAVVIQIVIMFAGIYLCFRVFNQITDTTGKIAGGVQIAAGTATALGAL